MYQVLRDTRKQKHIDVIDIAKELGLKTTATYYKKEKQEVPITVEEAKIISKMLGVSLDKLFK